MMNVVMPRFVAPIKNGFVKEGIYIVPSYHLIRNWFYFEILHQIFDFRHFFPIFNFSLVYCKMGEASSCLYLGCHQKSELILLSLFLNLMKTKNFYNCNDSKYVLILSLALVVIKFFAIL
jgi:hypothetical protein